MNCVSGSGTGGGVVVRASRVVSRVDGGRWQRRRGIPVLVMGCWCFELVTVGVSRRFGGVVC